MGDECLNKCPETCLEGWTYNHFFHMCSPIILVVTLWGFLVLTFILMASVAVCIYSASDEKHDSGATGDSLRKTVQSYVFDQLPPPWHHLKIAPSIDIA